MEPEKNNLMNVYMSPNVDDGKYSSLPLIAGILLIVTGVLSILGWIIFSNTDVSLLQDLLTQLQETIPSYTMEDLQNLIFVCSSIGIVVSIFPILSGILSVKKKMWGIALTGSILGIFSIIPIIFLIFLPVISMILLIISRTEFKR